MGSNRRLSITNHVIATVKDWDNLDDIRAAISSQLTEDERKLYEGE